MATHGLFFRGAARIRQVPGERAHPAPLGVFFRGAARMGSTDVSALLEARCSQVFQRTTAVFYNFLLLRPKLPSQLSILLGLKQLNMLKHLKTIGILAISALATASCSGPGEIHEYTVNDLDFSLEAPLFAGPNGAQAEVTIDLAEVLGQAYQEGMRISAANLKTATVHANDSLGFDQVNSFVVSFASDNEDVSMQEAAVKNPLEEGASEATLEVSTEAELGEIMADGKVYVILDADLAEDYWDGSRNFLLNFTLELTIK